MTDRIRILEGDITELAVDAIVNSANNDLILGAGIAGAINRKGGPSIQRECDEHGTIKVGEAAATRGGNLKADYVIHAAAMRIAGKATTESIRAATNSALGIARDKFLRTVAFPALGAGIAGYPLDRCAEIMIREVLDFFVVNDTPETVIFCLYGQEAKKVFEKVYKGMSVK